MEKDDLSLFFNFRSPYCYLASKTMWPLLENYHINLVWRPLGGWSGRSDPERAKIKIPLVRQDIKRWTAKLGIPMNPPPMATDPTRAAAASLLAEQQGKLKEYIIEVMRAEWGEGKDIGELDVLAEVAERIGMDADKVIIAADSAGNRLALERHAEEAQQLGAFGVPSFVIGEDIFWGNDRIDFVEQHLVDLRLAKR